MDSQKPIGLLLKQINDAVEKVINNNMRESDMTFAQLRVLHLLDCMGEKSCSLKELERILGVAQSTCAGLVCRLVQKKMVECMGDPVDKRVKIVCITQAGEDCCKVGLHNLNAAEQAILNGFSLEEKEQLRDLLERVYQNLKCAAR